MAVSQSAKISEYSGEQGYDGNKNIDHRMLSPSAHRNTQRCPTNNRTFCQLIADVGVKHVFVCCRAIGSIPSGLWRWRSLYSIRPWLENQLGIRLMMPLRIDVQAIWVATTSLGDGVLFGRYRRLSNDYKRYSRSSSAVVYPSWICRLSNYLTA